jgi:hypothetical protein
MLRPSDRPRLVLLALLAGVLLALPTSASAARLIGGRQQAALTGAFFRLPGHKGRAIVSIRGSSSAPAWTIVRWVIPTPSGGTSSTQVNPRLHSTYFHATRRDEAAGQPPAKVARELSAAFRVTVLYTGSGSERISYSQTYRSVCAGGGGGFVEQEQDAVAPLSWRVRYTVDVDRLLSAVRGAQGTVIVPAISLDSGASHLNAIERISRTYVDQGCFERPMNFACATTFHLVGAADELDFLPGQGTEIGIPMQGAGRGQCSAEDYTLGPSLWDSGGATILARSLGLIGGRLPANPYRSLRVSWPNDSAALQVGSLSGPCQGLASGCTDQFRWHGAVRLESSASG